jgi:hypothetical protein
MFGPVALAIPLGSAALQLGELVPLLLAAAVAFGVAGHELRRGRGGRAGETAGVSAVDRGKGTVDAR